MAKKNIVIVGAGPIGMEAALYAARLGHAVQVFEAGRIGGNMRRWGFVTLFSPWHMNASPLGLQALQEAGQPLPETDAHLSGMEYVQTYLEPLANSAALRGHVHEHHSVRQIGRQHLGKGLPLGASRAAHPFRVLVDGPQGDRCVEADVVLDCSGTYGNANALGSGNVPAVGERAAAHRIEYTLQDVTGKDRERYAGKRVLLAGSGHSAATAVSGLAALPETTITWIARNADPAPSPRIDDDPLPHRDALSRRVNALAAGGPPDTKSPPVRFLPGTTVDRLRVTPGGVEVDLGGSSGATTVVVDEVLAHVGYRPDKALYRELQVHECYATEGPMKLAATLLQADATDCLAQASAGPETLLNPEPNFFVLGAKSYGRNSQFLIRLGLSQVREVFTHIEERPKLDLYAA